jgi:hypothetical protein
MVLMLAKSSSCHFASLWWAMNWGQNSRSSFSNSPNGTETETKSFFSFGVPSLQKYVTFWYLSYLICSADAQDEVRARWG